jgi:hypothetical protein
VHLAGLAAAVLLAAQAASAQAASELLGSHLVGDRTLLLVAGERATVRLADDGRLTLLSVVHAEPAEAAPRGQAPPSGPGSPNPLVTTPPGTVAMVLGNAAGGARLKIENGTTLAFDYQAAMLDGAELPARAVATSVCTVLPHLASFENWERRRLPAMLLGGFASRQTSQVSCPEPRGPPAGLPFTPATPAPETIPANGATPTTD